MAQMGQTGRTGQPAHPATTATTMETMQTVQPLQTIQVDERELGVGRVYARAILDLAESQGAAESLLGELTDLAAYAAGNPEFESFLTSPLIEDGARVDVLEKIFRGRASDLLVDALQVVNRKGRIGLLRAIAQAYRQEYRALR
nr:F0F1 ATP synthase subunit delta [Acidobacteriota bacterium]